jgi:hypothetical protein
MHQINPIFFFFHSWIKENTTEWALLNSKSSHFQCTLWFNDASSIKVATGMIQDRFNDAREC